MRTMWSLELLCEIWSQKSEHEAKSLIISQVQPTGVGSGVDSMQMWEHSIQGDMIFVTSDQ
jgi:hypothetical protein